jgi:TRAP-type mannitol/chloroaromatic compound transport system substrate-binding protein
MKRREFVTGAIGGGAVAASGFPAPAIAQERFEWTMVTTWPAGFPGLGVGAQRFAGCVAAMSEGRLTIRDRPHLVGW